MKQGTTLALLIAILASSCTHYYYAPNTVHIPSLTEKNDLEISLGTAGGDQFSGVELQAAYSPLPHTLLTFQTFGANEKQTPTMDSEEFGYGRLNEIGLGGYYATHSGLIFQLTGGGGTGNVYHHYGQGYYSHLFFNRWYLQPAFLAKSKYVQAGLGLRLAWLDYQRGSIDLRIPPYEVEVLQRIAGTSNIFMPEIGFQIGAGVDPVWFKFHYTYSSVPENLQFANHTFMFGISVKPSYFWKKAHAPKPE